MQVKGISTPVLVAMIAVAAVLFVFGSTVALGHLTQRTREQTRTLPAAPTIAVSAETGDVRVVGGLRRDIRLTTKEQHSIWGSGHVQVSGDARDLRFEDSCDSDPVLDAPCDVSFVLEVPMSTSVRIAAETGDIHAESLEGSADIRVGTGDVNVTGVDGTVDVVADTGDARVAGASHTIGVRTGTGDVRVSATEPGTITTRTDTGDIHVAVPNLTYAVTTNVGTGDENVDVRPDDASPRRISATTGTGDVHVEQAR
jgi:hypothetical protein